MEIKIINTDIARLIDKKKSKIPAGKGTMMIASMQIKNKTVAKDFPLTTKAMSGAINEPTFGATSSEIFLFAIYYF